MWKRLRQWLAPSTSSPTPKPRTESRVEPDLTTRDELPVDLTQPQVPDLPHATLPEPTLEPQHHTAEAEADPQQDAVKPLLGTPDSSAPSAGESTQADTPLNTQPDMLVHVFATRRDAAQPDFPVFHAEHMAITDPNTSEPLQHLMRYVQGANPAELGPLRVQLCRHLQRVHHMWRLELSNEQLDAMGLWASQNNAVLALPDGSVRDPKGYVLLPAPGDREDELARIPHPPEAWQRKRRSESIMLEQSLSPDVSLPPIASEDEIDLRSAEAVAGRMLALLLVATQADMLSSRNPQGLNSQSLQDKLPQALAFLSPQEQAFMAQSEPDTATIQAMTWRYESMFTLMWALALVEDMTWPNQVCDTGNSVSQLLQLKADDLLENALLRPSKELLDQLDLHQRMHALAREAELNNRPLPQLNRSILMERHKALNWLVGHEHAAWDKVNTPN